MAAASKLAISYLFQRRNRWLASASAAAHAAKMANLNGGVMLA